MKNDGEMDKMSEPIRVLQVVTHMNRGGLETMIMNYYRNIDREKVQFDFLTHRPENETKDYDDEIRALGGRIFHISRLNPFSFRYKKELREFFRQHPEYRVVHVHQDCLSYVILHAAQKENVPVRIAHAHSSNQDKGIKFLIKCFYKRKIKRAGTHLFACGYMAGEWMFETKDFEVLPNAIDAEQYDFNQEVREEVRRELNIGNCFAIGNVARFSDVKNQEFLVNVFEALLRKNKDSKLILVGDGDNKNHIQEVVRNKGLTDNVIFTGLRNDVHRIMQALDVFVLPSLYEGLPVTMVEAQAAGLPCLVSDKVPMDCKITKNVEQLPLTEGYTIWADKLLTYKTFNRVSTFTEIVDGNFDIKNNAEKLQRFYLYSYENGQAALF